MKNDLVERLRTEAEANRLLARSTGIGALAESCEARAAMCDEAIEALSTTPGREEIVRALFWADIQQGEKEANEARIPDEWRDKWWGDSASMPLSGPGFLARWYAMADAILSLLRKEGV
ncbi:hypothetical protein ABIC65_001033 [Sphingomonas trueperi]|uniref:hypothetical protein n=1 Tax=Sphingomonas trueperi TaxID=53317 RepID=UPI0033980223